MGSCVMEKTHFMVTGKDKGKIHPSRHVLDVLPLTSSHEDVKPLVVNSLMKMDASRSWKLKDLP